MNEPTIPLFGGWSPTYEGDMCKGGHPPQSVSDGECGRCGRAIDLSRCLCGEESHRSGLSRSMCPNRMRLDMRDAETHADVINYRRWKAEALAVLLKWEMIWEQLDRPGRLGMMKADNCLEEIRKMQAELRELKGE